MEYQAVVQMPDQRDQDLRSMALQLALRAQEGDHHEVIIEAAESFYKFIKGESK
jgi:hypothetical protein